MRKSKYFYLRYSARIIGLISCIFFMFISFKGGLIQVIQGQGGDLIPFFPYLAIAITGYPVSYAKERKGGFIMLAGGTALFAFFMIYSGGIDWARAIVYGLPFIFCGAAFAFCNAQE